MSSDAAVAVLDGFPITAARAFRSAAGQKLNIVFALHRPSRRR